MIVIDASACVAVVFGEPGNEELTERLGKSRLAAPHLLRFEVANVAVIKARREPDRASWLERQLAMIEQFDLTLHESDWSAVYRLARLHRLTAYDASYLALSQRLQCPLVTLDRALARAAAAS